MIHDNIEMKEKGFSDEQIQRKNIRVRRNKKIKADEKHECMKIIWGADDETLYSFEEKNPKDGVPPKNYTVFSYNKERYNIILKYPKMPIVFLGNREWFPIEFLYQAFGKTKGANSREHVAGVLGYYDENSGTRCVDNISNLSRIACQQLQRNGLSFEHILRQFNLRRSTDAVELEAKVLPEPQLAFGNTKASLRNGSWDLRDKIFKRSVSLS